MPAARKVSGSAGHTSHFICTRCTLFGRDQVHNVECHKWTLQNVALLKQKAEEWRDAETVEERKVIYNEYHVRWSEFWRLPYWNPPRMLVTDVMHCILEGCVHYHCRHVLRIDAERAKEQDSPPVAFVHDWMPHSSLVPKDFQVNNHAELHQIEKIQNTLLLPFMNNIATALPPGFVDEAELSKKLLRNNKQPLKFVCFSLDLLGSLGSQQTKKDFVSLLVQWVRVLRTILFRTLNFIFSFSVASNLSLPKVQQISNSVL